MKLLLCLLGGFEVAHSQTEPFVAREPGAATKVSQNQPAQLQLTTSVVNRRYTIEYGVRMLRWTLKLTYTNTGNEPILLDKKSSWISRSMVSRDVKAAAKKKYESDTTGSWISVENLREAGMRDGDPEEDAFIVLQPGESHSVEKDDGERPYDRERTPDGLRPGNHFLQVRVNTWYYYVDPAPYAQKWRSKGQLQFQNITSQPMPFTIE